MKCNRRKVDGWTSGLFLMLLSASSWGVPIPVVNPGFDFVGVTGPAAGVTNPLDGFTQNFGIGVALGDASIPPQANCLLGGCFINGTANALGWVGTSALDTAAGHLDDDAWGAIRPDGAAGAANAGFTRGTNFLTQEIAGALGPNTTYTLLVDLFLRSGVGIDAPDTILVQLRSGGSNLGGVLSINPFVDGASMANLVFTSDGTITPNSDLEILLGAAGTSSAFQQINFDSVTLDATRRPAPEPTTLALIGLGLAGLGFARRRKLHA